MIKLLKYYSENFSKHVNFYYDDRHLKNLISDYETYKKLEDSLDFVDDRQIIESWKSMLYPGQYNDEFSEVFDELRFLYMSYYLWNEKYIVKDFTDIFNVFKGRNNLSNVILYNSTEDKYGRNDKGHVTWKNRRKFIDNLSLIKKTGILTVKKEIDDLFVKISTRTSDFHSMSTDEKLENIRNVYEYLIVEYGGFYKIDYITEFMGFINEENLKKYSKLLHIFRHGNPDSIKERAMYSENEKKYMIDFGILILNKLHK